jgi:hypothetical protein
MSFVAQGTRGEERSTEQASVRQATPITCSSLQNAVFFNAGETDAATASLDSKPEVHGKHWLYIENARPWTW